MTEVTIEITQFCEHNCDYCSSNATLDGQHLSYDDVKDFLIDLEFIPSRINISGGEPLANPDFYRILKLCEEVGDEVIVYTNALKKVIYNTDVIKEIEIHANVCMSPGKSHYIPKNADMVHVLKLIHQGRARDIKPINIKVSRNFWNEGACEGCDHVLLQADKKVVVAPCLKLYDSER